MRSPAYAQSPGKRILRKPDEEEMKRRIREGVARKILGLSESLRKSSRTVMWNVCSCC